MKGFSMIELNCWRRLGLDHTGLRNDRSLVLFDGLWFNSEWIYPSQASSQTSQLHKTSLLSFAAFATQ
jgi:hypothetical protein